MMLLSGQPLTPAQIATQIPDVPLGTIYRHLNLLLRANMIKITEERRVKGTVERRFVLVGGGAFLTDDERKNLTPEEINGLVAALTGAVQATFYRYTQQAVLPPREGEIALVTKSLYLTAAEYAEFRQQIIALLAKWERQPDLSYERRMISFFSAPDPEAVTPQESKGNSAP